MNKLSKAYQLRNYRKVEEPERKERKPLRTIGKKGRRNLVWDGLCADEAMSRDGFECIAHRWLWKEYRNGTVVHHIQGKNTHHGPERRFMLLWQITLCEECHADTESQNGHDRWLDIGAREDSETMGTQLLRQTKLIDGQRVTKEAERPSVANWNPIQEQD